jgi:tripartite-type tricarboxylate transporter receptor subunit TctC
VLLQDLTLSPLMTLSPLTQPSHGTPPDRIKILRDAFTKTLSDPAAVEEAKKGRMDIDPASGEELEKLVKEIFDSSPDVVERVKKILAN